MQHESWHVTSPLAARAILVVLLAALLAACGGGGGEGGGSPPAPAATSATATIDTAGGTVALPSGARVAIPAGALVGATTIAVESGAGGAPALPAGVTALGPIVAFTPHGTTFATPVTISVPFDPASVPAGITPALYKTNAAGSWEAVPGATVAGNTMTGQVSGFSWAVVAPPPPSIVLASEAWHYELTKTAGATATRDEIVVLPEQSNAGQPLDDCYPAEYCWTTPPDSFKVPFRVLNDLWWGSRANANVDGSVFYSTTIAPTGDPFTSGKSIGLANELKVTRVMRKLTDRGSTKATVSHIDFDAKDGVPFDPRDNYCPGFATGGDDACRQSMLATVDLVVDAWLTLPNGGYITLRHAEATAVLFGWRAHFAFDAMTGAGSDVFVWDGTSFDTSGNDPADQGQTARATLKTGVSVDIPLDLVPAGGEFTVMVTLRSYAYNRRQLESAIGAGIKDPATGAGGVSFVDNGVEVVRVATPRSLPAAAPPPPTRVPVPPCAGAPDPAAGTLQLSAAALHDVERAGARTPVLVTRTGGSKGAASVRLATANGTATSGVDYTPVSTVVRFEDGEQGSRGIEVPIVDNDIVDGDRTVLLTLDSLGGCAALGAQTTATLTLHDNDALPPPVAFNVSGTVTGLAGSGLVLRDTFGGTTTRPVADGTYVLASQVVNGTSYDIVVDTQPSNPAQACTVAKGSGTIAGADVTNVAVTCTAVVPNGSLDTSFAGTGKVSNAFPSAKAIALQADGKIVAVGGMVLSRYNANGSLDTTFGGGTGKVTIVANGGGLDAMQAVAVQPDGRIVVAGMTSLPTVSNDDFVIVRFNSDGTPDTTFNGNGNGKVVVDFAGLADRAYAVLVQSDGSIVAAGFATLGTLATANQDVAVVRVLANGTLDTSFGTGGKATVNMAGRGDFGYAAALQADGKIVVAGRAAPDGGSAPDFGLVRLQSNGTVDTGFGTHGVARIDFGGAAWDEAGDVVVQADGSIVAGGYTQTGGVYRYALARLTSGGVLDTTFGTGGLVSTPFSGSGDFGRALTLQADGRIVVAGQVGSTTANPDVGVARYLANGALDSTFGSNGLVQVDFFGAIDNANDLLVQPDGRIVAAGSARNGSTTGLGLVRVMP